MVQRGNTGLPTANCSCTTEQELVQAAASWLLLAAHDKQGLQLHATHTSVHKCQTAQQHATPKVGYIDCCTHRHRLGCAPVSHDEHTTNVWVNHIQQQRQFHFLLVLLVVECQRVWCACCERQEASIVVSRMVLCSVPHVSANEALRQMYVCTQRRLRASRQRRPACRPLLGVLPSRCEGAKAAACTPAPDNNPPQCV